MAKMMGPRFKQCRRLGLNVCGHPKAMNRATKGTARNDKKLSDYGTQLLEKQRLRAYYGVMEKQFANYFEKASKSRELTGHALINLLECRLDNLVSSHPILPKRIRALVKGEGSGDLYW